MNYTLTQKGLSNAFGLKNTGLNTTTAPNSISRKFTEKIFDIDYAMKKYAENAGIISQMKLIARYQDRLIFNGPATILLYDGKRTVVKCSKEENFDWKKGAMMVLLKQVLAPEQYKRFTSYFHDRPSKEKSAAEGILLIYVGDETLRRYLSYAKSVWKNSQK